MGYKRIIWSHEDFYSQKELRDLKDNGHCNRCSYKFYKDGRIKIVVIENGWLAEVPEEKELWEKLMDDDTSDPPIQETFRGYWKDKAKIARQHFAEVARKAEKGWNDLEVRNMNIIEYIIQAIEKDG